MNWNLIGHQWAVNLLKRHIQNGSIRHAYLFTGPVHVGKTTLALRFAQALNCETPSSTGEFCGECRACRLISACSHPDLHIIEPEQDREQLVIDQIRKIQRTLALAPHTGKWRIAILPEFARANYYAQNALLKTLEEPASKVVLLLTAVAPEDLLPTISSRCENIALRQVGEDQMQASLAKSTVAVESQRLIGTLAGGSPGLAIRMHADPELLTERKIHIEALMSYLSEEVAERFVRVEDHINFRTRDMSKKRSAIMAMLEIWISLLRDLLLAGNGMQHRMINVDYENQLIEWAQSLAEPKIIELMNEIQLAQKRITQNVNPRLVVENLLLELPVIK